MNFTPKSAEELQLAELMPEGEYDFKVLSAEDAVSKKGNDMLKLKLAVYVGQREYHVFDYLLEAMAFKLRHFCESTGLLDLYEDGILTADDCDGAAGIVEIEIEKPKEGSKYGPKNVVADYISRDAVRIESAPPKPKQTAQEPLDVDDIPF